MKLVLRSFFALILLGLACNFLAGESATTAPPPPTVAAPQPGQPTDTPIAVAGATNTPRVIQTQATIESIPPTETAPADASLTPILFPDAPDAAKYNPTLIGDGFSQPLYLTHAGDHSGRLFVVEQTGTIRIIQNGAILPLPFLDIHDLITTAGLEQGLLGLAFHPRFADGQHPFFFVNYTDANGNTVVARYNISSDPNVADPNSATTILTVDQPYPNHNGGDLVFGPDGYLYIGLGDGGSGGDPQGNGQNLGVLLGKLLRIDVDSAQPYGIPPDNPLVGRDARPEIWAYGLRNPWRYSFDRATRDLYIADVGQDIYEEVDFQPANSKGGENYGWNFMEGLHPYEGQQAPGGLTAPVTEYSHSQGGCSITGGYVYRGKELPALSGVYFFGDFCSGKIWALFRTAPDRWKRVLMFESGLNTSSFGEDEAGELYIVDRNGGIYRVTGGG